MGLTVRLVWFWKGLKACPCSNSLAAGPRLPHGPVALSPFPSASFYTGLSSVSTASQVINGEGRILWDLSPPGIFSKLLSLYFPTGISVSPAVTGE